MAFAMLLMECFRWLLHQAIFCDIMMPVHPSQENGISKEEKVQ